MEERQRKNSQEKARNQKEFSTTGISRVVPGGWHREGQNQGGRGENGKTGGWNRGRGQVTKIQGDTVRDCDFIPKAAEVLSMNDMLSFIFQKGHLGCSYENRLKVGRLMGKL